MRSESGATAFSVWDVLDSVNEMSSGRSPGGDYGASEASVVFRRLTEISVYERPAGCGHAFARTISQQPLDRFTCGNFCRVASSLLPTNGELSMHVGDL